MPRLIKDDVRVRVEGDDPIAGWSFTNGWLPDCCRIKEVAILAKGAERLLAITDVEFRRCDETTTMRKCTPLAAYLNWLFEPAATAPAKAR
ncbi:hypothetical protein [Sphingobium sp. AP50]|uniref:hypothetical protein n=1 Tax=Sphingobium sp. AP50 TaxID=1884369 RepID=UPI0015A55D69|nr:hypothetical protein [Sphingobium sp. AP50]